MQRVGGLAQTEGLLDARQCPCGHPSAALTVFRCPRCAPAAGAALAAADKAQVVRQLGVVTPANSILGILGCQADPSSEVDPGLCEMETSEG